MPQVYTYLGLLVGVDWESLKAIDGFWVDFNASSSGYGGHNDPFHTMNNALAATTDGTKLRFKTGTSNWTGTISATFGLPCDLRGVRGHLRLDLPAAASGNWRFRIPHARVEVAGPDPPLHIAKREAAATE